MRISPDSVYIEVEEKAMIYNSETGKTRYVPSLLFHFKLDKKAGTKWKKVAFFADEGESLGDLMARIGKGIDYVGGLNALFHEVEESRAGRPSGKVVTG